MHVWVNHIHSCGQWHFSVLWELGSVALGKSTYCWLEFPSVKWEDQSWPSSVLWKCLEGKSEYLNILGETNEMIIQTGYCKEGHCISCLQRGTVLMLGVNGGPWSSAPSYVGCWLFYLPLTANCHSSPESDFFSTIQHFALKVLYSFIWLYRISELEIL